ncbi:MAG: type II secretion system protein [Elusimicrobia bacterium]|nr:type II secretion system protein [Elusimicrobiota bacterium]
MKTRDESGFTLIEMLVVVLGITIIAAIAIPRYGESLRASTEGYTRGSLGSIRKALSVYYSDLEGQYPADLASLTQNKRYLRSLPPARLPGLHADSAAVHPGAAPADAGGWLYDDSPASPTFGAFRVDCTHTDSKGSVWSSY